MALTNEEYIADGANHCPHCGSLDIVGAEVEIGPGTAYQEVSCSACNAVWTDKYTLVSYETTEQPTDPDGPEVIEYSVCEDCLLSIAHGHSDNMTGADNAHLEARMKAEMGDREGHWTAGVPPTEEDPEGNGYDEFSGCACELCNSGLAGSRHGVSLVIPKK